MVNSGLNLNRQSPSRIVAQDGSGDHNGVDHKPINLALKELNEEGGGHLHIKKGAYNISEQITLYDNIKITGEGNNTIIKVDSSIDSQFFLFYLASISNVEM